MSREFLAATPKQERWTREQWTYSWATRAQDPYYEMLFVKKPRDSAKEGQLLSTLVQLFEDKPDATVGGIACNADFCRVELLGTGQVDLLGKYGKLFVSALDPKGFSFVMSDNNDPENPKVSLYFGRTASWTVPDFVAELGL